MASLAHFPVAILTAHIDNRKTKQPWAKKTPQVTSLSLAFHPPSFLLPPTLCWAFYLPTPFSFHLLGSWLRTATFLFDYLGQNYANTFIRLCQGGASFTTLVAQNLLSIVLLIAHKRLFGRKVAQGLVWTVKIIFDRPFS